MADLHAATEVDGVPLTVNGTPIVARKGELLIEAAARAGTYIPHFCYHPRMAPVGMCRMCIVEVDTGRGPALQPACMLECTPDMVVDTESEVTKKAQDGVLEFLLINHPLDCPVCDKGGECPLQDQTIAYGPGESRFVEEKRHNEKPIPVSELVLLDRERCILCDRCTRFAKDVAGDPLIHFVQRGSSTEVSTFPDHPFASYFSGNTVQICPVGALTASPYRFKARPWDLDQVESTCTTCAVGCRIATQTSRNEILRHQGVDSDPVNWGWLCDKGRFGFEAVHSDDRLTEPLVRRGEALEPVRWSDALGAVAGVVSQVLAERGPTAIGVLGGARLTNEDAYAWVKLAKGVLGTDNVDCQLGDGLPPELVLGTPRATIDEVCAPGGTVVLLAPDLKEELPVLYLRLRAAAVEHGVRIVEVSSLPTGLSTYAAARVAPRPGEIGEVVAALVAGRTDREVGGVAPEALAAAAALLTEGPVTVIAGRPSIAESPVAIVDAVAALLHGIPGTRVLSALRRGNVHGALDAGMAPGLLPGRVTLEVGRDRFADAWPTVPAGRGLGATDMLAAAADGELDVLFLLGVDLDDIPDRDLVARALAGARLVVALDQFANGSSSRADVILPVAGAGECDGTTTNLEGRVTQVAAAVTPPGTAQSDWIVAVELARLLGADLGATRPADLWAELEHVGAAHGGVTTEVLRSPLAVDGIVLPLADPAPYLAAMATPVSISNAGAPVTAATDAETTDDDEAVDEPTTSSGPALLVFDPPEATPPTPVDSYSLRLVSGRQLYDDSIVVRRSPSLAGLRADTVLRINPYDFDRLGVGVGDEVRISTNRGAATIACHPDGDVPRGAASLRYAQPNLAVAALLDATLPVTDLRVETVG